MGNIPLHSEISPKHSALRHCPAKSLIRSLLGVEAGELLDFVAGGLSDNHLIAFTDKIQELKESRLGAGTLPGLGPPVTHCRQPGAFFAEEVLV